MKRPIVIIGIAIGLAVVVVLVGRIPLSRVSSGASATVTTVAKSPAAHGAPRPPQSAPASAVTGGETPPSATPSPPEGASRRPVIPRPDPPDPPAKVALNAVALNLRNYGFRFGGNPTGSNAEITKALNGDNPARAKYLPAEHTHISPQGELLDLWGTPYFFHQQSANETVIRSAGPDRKLYTVDDITAK